LDFASDDSLKDDQIDALYAYAESYIPIAQENAARKAVQIMAQQGMSPMETPQPTATEQHYGTENNTETAPNTLGGTASQSQEITPTLI